MLLKKNKTQDFTITNGPFYLINNNEPKIVENLQDYKGNLLSAIYSVALCWCSTSKNKPFCYDSHNNINFKDDEN
ncbi:MAG: CDGSH iron-sulfur domain-containing protein [Candidatus Nitrosocosmicus sp.]